MTSWKRTFGIHVCCSFLVVAFLVAVPFLSTAQPSGEAAADAAAGPEIAADPLGRLPSTPEEAHQSLEARDVVWPEAGAGGDFSAASVNPGVRVSIPYDTVEGLTDHPGQNVQVALYDGSMNPKGPPVVVTAGDDGFFTADLAALDIQFNDTVVVTDLAGGAPVNVSCYVDGTIDYANNRVYGNAIGFNALLNVYIVSPSTYYGDVMPGVASAQTAPSIFTYTYDVSFPGFDLRPGDIAYLFNTDQSGNVVMNVAPAAQPRLVVYPQYDDVLGYYLSGVNLTVQADVVTRNAGTQGDGFFEAWFSDYDIKAGTTVSCNMGGTRGVIVQDVIATCEPVTNLVSGTAPASRDIRVTMDLYGSPAVIETRSNSAGAFSVDFTGTYDVIGQEVYNVTWYDDDGDAVVYQFQTFSWYLAEGYTGGQFDTWVLVQNPGTDDAFVTMTFQLVNGTASPYHFTLPGKTRKSVHLDELPGLADAEVSTTVTSASGNWIIAERAEYFIYDGKPGGHDSIGTLTPAETWFLAEGYTGGQFDTWVLVQNPGTEAANVTLDFQLVNGTAPSMSFILPVGKRQSVHLDELPGLADAEVSTKVTSTKPVVAERAEYFVYDGKPGGSDSIGVPKASTEWYLAEGYTGGQFDTWVLVQNPGTETATVTLSFQLVNGAAAPKTFDLAAGKRQSVHLDELPGLADAEVSTKMTSTKPVVAERAEYFVYDGKPGGHDSIGTTTPGLIWYLAEGYTGQQFDTWVLVQNPGTEAATVTLSFQLVSGTAQDKVINVPAGKRVSVHLDELPGLADAQVSTKVSSNKPVVSERAMYFIYDGKPGGSDSIGVPEVL